MKRILLAAGLGLGILSFTMAGANHATAPVSHHLKTDTVPSDTSSAPKPDTTKIVNQ